MCLNFCCNIFFVLVLFSPGQWDLIDRGMQEQVLRAISFSLLRKADLRVTRQVRKCFCISTVEDALVQTSVVTMLREQQMDSRAI